MRRNVSRLAVGLAAALLPALPAAAQKIAPSRQFGAAVDTYSGPGDLPARTYAPAPQTSTPDKNFGLPTFGNPAANMPQQRATVPVKPRMQEVAPGVLEAAPMPSDPMSTPDDTDPVEDAFARSGGNEKLPSEMNRNTASGETQLFTTTEVDHGPAPTAPGAAAPAPQADSLFTTGPATPPSDGSTLEKRRMPGERSALESTRAPDPLAIGQ